MTYDGVTYPGVSPTWGDYYLLCVDSSGTHQWGQTGTGPHLNEGREIAIDENQNIYVVGKFSNYMDIVSGTINAIGTGGTTTEIIKNGDGFLVKYDISGNQLWFNHIGSQFSNDFTAVTVCDSTVLVIGTSLDTLVFLGSMDSLIPTPNNHNAMIIAYNLESNYSWSKLIESSAPATTPSYTGTSGNAGIAITNDLAGNIYTGGYFNYTSFWDTTTIASVSSFDAHIGKIFPPLKGDVYGQYFIGCTTDTLSFSYSAKGSPITTAWTSSSGIVVSQSGNSVEIAYTNEGLDTITCIASNGYQQDTITVNVNITNSGCAGVDKFNSSFINVYPNPSDSKFYLTISSGINYLVQEIHLINASGNVIKTLSFEPNKTVIDLENFSPGLYFVSIVMKDGTVHTEKLIKK